MRGCDCMSYGVMEGRWGVYEVYFVAPIGGGGILGPEGPVEDINYMQSILFPCSFSFSPHPLDDLCSPLIASLSS